MMDFFEAVRVRRSVRKYTSAPVPESVIERGLDAALLAPNSSNMQTWGFYRVRSPEKKAKLVEACLSQGAAKTAQELMVVTAEPRLWKRNRNEMIRVLQEAKARPILLDYYRKLMPFVYGYQWLAPVKWLVFNLTGLFRPMMRHPWSPAGRELVAVKSAALACENFMLAVSAQGFGTCPMEGFDEKRIKRLLGLSW
ncbi:MAG: nitroreductase family protein, partial [Proteobacteria bacterium]|nr:nitroreductase family protein [Pseudomonadota bacterium]